MNVVKLKAKAEQNKYNGLLAVNKPRGTISKDVSRWLVDKLGRVRLGHVGTLDPNAEGVLPILFGRATRLQDYLLELPKVYEFEVEFGRETDTLDCEGEIVAEAPWEHLTIELIAEAKMRSEEPKIEKEGDSKDEKDSSNLSEQEKTVYKDMIFINPKILKTSKKQTLVEEGCLSVRWLYGKVSRPEKTLIKAYDEEGKAFTMGGSGLLSQAFQHETDHLEGVLFTDKAKELKEISPVPNTKSEIRNPK